MNWITWALGAALFAGLTAVLAKAGIGGMPPNLATAIRTSVAFVFAWALACCTLPAGALPAIPRRGWLFLVLSGLATGLSWVCYFQALQKGPVSKVAPVDKLSVPIALFLAFLFLGEKISLQTAAGASLIVLGTLVIAAAR